MTLRRLLANLLAGLVLVAILVGLVFVIIDERCSKNVSGQDKPIVQEIPFGGGRK
jgi:F0F1-type ATP synthase membrane subunit a